MKPLKVGYLGPEGTFCEEAGGKYILKLEKSSQLVPYSTLHDLLQAANKGIVSEAVAPIENSIEGTINIVSDALAKEVNLKIRQEIILPISHNLIAPIGTKLTTVTHIISHPQAIDQCKDFLKKYLPQAQIHFAFSTADAVKQVAESVAEKIEVSSHGKKVFAAIGTSQAARLYGLSIIKANINPKDNQTRFVVLAKTDHTPTGKDKTSIVLAAQKDQPGSLHAILGEFSKRKINLTKIESRPAKKILGEYLFFIDFAKHRKDKEAKAALDAIQKLSSFFKLLGSYPRYS